VRPEVHATRGASGASNLRQPAEATTEREMRSSLAPPGPPPRWRRSAPALRCRAGRSMLLPERPSSRARRAAASAALAHRRNCSLLRHAVAGVGRSKKTARVAQACCRDHALSRAIEAAEVWCASLAGSAKCVEDRSRQWRTQLRQIGLYFGLFADDDDDPQPVSFKTWMKFMIPIFGAWVVVARIARILADATGIRGVVGFLVHLALVVILSAIVGIAAALLTWRQGTGDA